MSIDQSASSGMRLDLTGTCRVHFQSLATASFPVLAEVLTCYFRDEREVPRAPTALFAKELSSDRVSPLAESLGSFLWRRCVTKPLFWS